MKLIAFLVAALVAVGAASPSAALTFPDRGRAAVVDAAHILPPDAAADLNRRIVAWDRATGHQLAVATVPSLQGTTIADYGYQMGRAWGLGRKGVDDGILFLIAPTEHKVRIEVGRGLEGDLTDAETSVILSGTVVHKLKAGDMAGAISDGADAIMQAVPADAGDTANAPAAPSTNWLAWLLGIAGVIGAAGITAFVISARRQKKRMDEMADYQRRMRDRVERDIADGARRSAPISPRSTGYSRPSAARIPVSGSAAPSRMHRPPSAPPSQATPVIISDSFNSSPSYDSGTSSSSSDWGSSASSSDSGSSGFDSGGGSFSGGGSDSSW